MPAQFLTVAIATASLSGCLLALVPLSPAVATPGISISSVVVSPTNVVLHPTPQWVQITVAIHDPAHSSDWVDGTATSNTGDLHFLNFKEASWDGTFTTYTAFMSTKSRDAGVWKLDLTAEDYSDNTPTGTAYRIVDHAFRLGAPSQVRNLAVRTSGSKRTVSGKLCGFSNPYSQWTCNVNSRVVKVQQQLRGKKAWKTVKSGRTKVGNVPFKLSFTSRKTARYRIHFAGDSILNAVTSSPTKFVKAR